MNKPILTIGLLVSNRIDTIEKCLNSLKPLLEELPAELIVADTVGPEKTDGSLYIAEKFTDKVTHFEWCNDFSAARNATLLPAKGEWFMFLDDDEWFEDVTEIIDFFKSGEYKNYNSATYIIRNYTDFEGTGYGDSSILRMIKRTPSLKFEGNIHEHFNKVYRPCKRFECFVHHYGYVYTSEEQKKAHSERNMSLLQKEIEKNPMDLRLHTQMALELANFDNVNAIKYVQSALQLFSSEASEPCYQWLTVLQFRLYEALGFSVEFAEKTYNSLVQKSALNETALCAANYCMMRICLIKDDKNTAFSHGMKYMELINLLNSNPKKKADQDYADFARYISEDAIRTINEYLLMCQL
ncbi:MAG: glycosyltransferase [Lachnospiraceae bacterium]|nr:glycosyltransferase [Lachnospiraceae bacterium]